MTTDIGSLVAGLDVHVVRLAKDSKNKVRSQIFSRRTHFSIVDSLAVALLNITTRLPDPLGPLLLTLFAPLVSSLLLHYFSHDIRLVIASLRSLLPLPI
jgi:hypothetical protein